MDKPLSLQMKQDINAHMQTMNSEAEYMKNNGYAEEEEWGKNSKERMRKVLTALCKCDDQDLRKEASEDKSPQYFLNEERDTLTGKDKIRSSDTTSYHVQKEQNPW